MKKDTNTHYNYALKTKQNKHIILTCHKLNAAIVLVHYIIQIRFQCAAVRVHTIVQHATHGNVSAHLHVLWKKTVRGFLNAVMLKARLKYNTNQKISKGCM